MFKGQIGVDGERGRTGAPGQPVSVKMIDFHTVMSLSVYKACTSAFCLLCFYLYNCDFQGHPGSRGQQGPKGAKGDQVRM